MIAETPLKGVLRSRIATWTPQLKCLETTKDLTAHQALVKHMHFSSNGTSWDRTSLISRVGHTSNSPHKQAPFVSHRILAHAKGFVHQVAWSPSGHLLLTKINKSVKVWTEMSDSLFIGTPCLDGVCQRTIDRPLAIESITWLPGGDGAFRCAFWTIGMLIPCVRRFLSVEGTLVAKLVLTSTIK
ncbi:hypothetical protein BDZ89DRAFT_963668 [Hymenopellis radicata]|nr:hypothetical protein BDZ89DRAFT_963668 [Hymenopellis radicata]